MKLAIACDVFPPLRSSGAVQLRDLSLAFAAAGHDVTVLVASPELAQPWQLEQFGTVRVLRLRSPRTKDIGYVRRTLGELLMPHFMWFNLRRSPLAHERWDGIVWYSPTIFLSPLVRAIKRRSACRSYLIIRDIFPEWAVDMGLMGRGLPYRFFKAVAHHQYGSADVIGIQSPGNRAYFPNWPAQGPRRVEVLQNWLADAPISRCSIALNATRLAGRTIFVYAGNMGVAQGMGLLLELARAFLMRHDLGFVFVGRGSDAARLRTEAEDQGLDNTLFYDEIDPDEIPGLYAQCKVGIVALDPRHKTHNIPGKFLSYMQAGLPVLAAINPGNDLEAMIETERVGRVCTDASVATLTAQAERLVAALDVDGELPARCRALARRCFSPEATMAQITAALGQAMSARVAPNSPA